MLGSLPQGAFFFWRNDIPEILRHVHFEQNAILLSFGENIDLDTQRDSREALWKLSEGSQETLRELPDAICVSKALGQSWKAFHAETIMFFLSKVKKGTYSLQNGEGDMHQVL